MGNELIFKHIDELIPYENNPRINDNAVDAVVSSIKSFGFKVPIIIDRNNVIIAGHTRLKASQKLGLDEVPCIIADDLTDEQIKAFRLADNKTTEFAEWDDSLLMAELENIVDIDMDVFGFDLYLSVEPVEEIQRDEIELKDAYEVIITCDNENHLEETYEKLTREGYSCRISTL